MAAKNISWGGRKSDNSDSSNGKQSTQGHDDGAQGGQGDGSLSGDGIFGSPEPDFQRGSQEDETIMDASDSKDDTGMFGMDEKGDGDNEKKGSATFDSEGDGLLSASVLVDLTDDSDWMGGGDGNEPNPVEEREQVLPELEKDRLYVFMYGKPQAGKSVILSGLLRFLETDDSVTWHVDIENMDRASRIKLNELKSSIRKKKFVSGTEVLKQDSRVWELKGTLTPNNRSKRLPELKLAFLELAGEDLKKIIVGNSAFTGDLDPRIRHYLTSWDSIDNMCFFMVAPADEAAEHEDALTDMFQYMSSKGMMDAPTIVMLSKWDKLGDAAHVQGMLARILQEEMPSTWQQIRSMNRDVATMRFTIGESDDGVTFSYNPADSKILARRLYRIGTGYDRDPWDVDTKRGFIQKLLGK